MTDEEIRLELEKVASLVATAQRLLSGGATVELLALEDKVRVLCEGVAGVPDGGGRRFLPDLEALLTELDTLEVTIRGCLDLTFGGAGAESAPQPDES